MSTFSELNVDGAVFVCIIAHMKESKAATKQLAQSVIDSYSNGKEFSREDCELMSELCGYHFDQVKKIKHRMISVICPSENYSGTWSWNKSIDGYCNEKNTVQAMRTAIRDGSYGNHKMVSCEVCGSIDNLTVDHKKIPFSEIALQFKVIHGNPDIVNIDGYGWVLKHAKGFIDFHDGIANYQTLCRSCNSKKGNKTL